MSQVYLDNVAIVKLFWRNMWIIIAKFYVSKFTQIYVLK